MNRPPKERPEPARSSNRFTVGDIVRKRDDWTQMTVEKVDAKTGLVIVCYWDDDANCMVRPALHPEDLILLREAVTN